MELNTNSPTSKLIASVGILTLGGCSVFFNAHFGHSLGTTDLTRWVFAAMSVGFDIAKIMCLPIFVHHIAKQAWKNAFAAGLIWAIAVVWGMTAAVGFATVEQAGIAADHGEKVAKRKAYDEDVARLTADIEKAKGAINEKGGNIFQNTGSCLNPTKADSVKFCTAYLVKLGELNEIRRSEPKAEHRDPQPFLTLLADTFGTTKRAAGFAMAIAMAVVLETVTALASLAFTKTIAKPGTSARAVAKADQRRAADARRERRRQSRRQKPSLSIVR